jgi:hypothetical protein
MSSDLRKWTQGDKASAPYATSCSGVEKLLLERGVHEKRPFITILTAIVDVS